MNTKLIQSAITESLPNCPPLSSHKQSKTVTKHFTNLAVYMEAKHFALFCWLIYQSNQDCTIDYSTHLLRKYREYLIQMAEEYRDHELPTSLQIIRQNLYYLIKQGYIFNRGGELLLNPMFVFSKKTNKAKYKRFVEKYQAGDIKELTNFETLL